ncbi:MAG: phenylalanine--tRNA ligase subunit alpha [Ignavibacteriales bacterium CG_4_9_14_3_um_filter_34_10]|nr:MAG: phenylalanine--tRNA ligase subunit alpha [Ignavibacteriales bacterium CG_4_9_14_3_um_filter_34_10]
MTQKILLTESEFNSDLLNIIDSKSLEEIRIKYFSKKGKISQLFDEFRSLSADEKKLSGKRLNELKSFVQSKLDELKNSFPGSEIKDEKFFDLSLPGREKIIGSKHILIQTLDEIKLIFKGLGFSIHEGPELESDYNNFEALNFPPDHPARDMQDTFFVNKNFLLRTHTSPVQIRLMKAQQPPVRAIMPGKVYRNEAVSAKSYCLFHQVEGLYVDTDVTFAELKGTLIAFARQFFGKDVRYRFRPSFFPFTEPSAEVDIWWQPKDKPGRWLEILGCGMVDPNVLDNVGVDSEKYVGYAFGMGVERIALLKYKIGDIRVFFDNDKRFLTQF